MEIQLAEKKAKVGIVGWRGMVGSVLMDRFHQEQDFRYFEPIYFTTSQAGKPGPDGKPLKDGYDIDALAELDAIVVCQGSDYSKAVHPKLEEKGYPGIWIDAASAFRMRDDALICLDPVNGDAIQQALKDGTKLFIGGNCTVSLMLMAIGGLIKAGLVEGIQATTYQAISGSGAKALIEMFRQTSAAGELFKAHDAKTALEQEELFRELWSSADFPQSVIGQSLVGNLLPWIDSDLGDGTSREECKGYDETNKILGLMGMPIPTTSTCVRVPVMRCHSHSLALKLKEQLPLAEVEALIASSNSFVQVVPNTKEATLTQLTPKAVTGSLNIPIGRLRYGHDRTLHAFTVGDQLLWGAAEPVRRTLLMALPHISDVKVSLD